jgi:3-phenylpropionate/trans-cinnamate dioxygenase ferredoxin reductase component
MTLAIVGGGLAGATAAAQLREQGYDGPVVLYAAEQHLPYERPPLSKGFLLGRDQQDKMHVHDAAWYADHGIDLRLGTSVTAIAPEDHLLRTSAGTEPYTRLLLATGAYPRRLALADETGVPAAYLRTIEDSVRLREAFAQRPRVAIVGAGWIGLEVAAAAREAGCEVAVHDLTDLPLRSVLGPEVAQVFADLHRAHGVNLVLGSPVSAAVLKAADLVVVGIGAIPQISLAQAAGLQIANGILVDAQLRTSNPDIYAVGDVANHDHPVLGRVRSEHWDNAIEQAKTAARNMLGGKEPYARQPYFFTDQYDLGMEYFGHVGPHGYDTVVIKGDTKSAFRAYWERKGTVVAAMQANDWDASDEVRASIGTASKG